jgi:prepilin-type N-terminal cleavage/methylation domain-containing protein
MNSMSHRQKGFTLVEILIVVSILVLLGLIALVGINPMTQIFKGYDARRRVDLNKIKIALEAYYSDHECYPLFPLKDTKGRPSYVCNSGILKPYLDSIPCDPSTKKPYTLYLIPDDSTCPQQFAIYAQMFSFFNQNATLAEYCPKILDNHSQGINNLEIIYGCSLQEICPVHYGCRNGACVVVTDDDLPTCGPNFCSSDCSPVRDTDGSILVDCSTVNPNTGEHTRECVAY